MATPTASGKSLVFMSYATSRLLADPSRRVLALYPAKALLADQVEKWRQALTGTNLEVGRIDGSVPRAQRLEILKKSQVLAMTPDTFHAWAMSSLEDRDVAEFIRSLDVIVLDEAHVYNGVFGSNVAFLMRRVRVHAPRVQLVASTATLGQPGDIFTSLTGCQARVFDAVDDGSERFTREIVRGFTRQHGVPETYSPGNRFRQQPLCRYIESTGVCFCFSQLNLTSAQWRAMAKAISEAACARLSLHPGDIDRGRFTTRDAALSLEGPLSGACVFDSTYGSLRLTARLFDELEEILRDLAASVEDPALQRNLGALLEAVEQTKPAAFDAVAGSAEEDPSQRVQVILRGSSGILRHAGRNEVVSVERVFYTPHGVMYQVACPVPEGVAPTLRLVSKDDVQPLHGTSEMGTFDPFSNEVVA